MDFFIATHTKVNKPCIPAETFHQGVAWVVDAGEYIYFMPLFAELLRQLANIDAHTASIFGSEMAYRATMGAEYSYTQRVFSNVLGSGNFDLTAVQRDLLAAQTFFIDFITFEEFKPFSTLLDTFLDTENL